MSKSLISGAKISGIAVVSADNLKRMDDDMEYYNGDKKKLEKVKKMVGLDKRYVVDGQTTAADLCESAAIALINDMGVNKEEIGALIMVTQTPDYFLPATSAYLHGKLNLSKDCAAFDVSLGCSGYIYGLWLAFMMVENKSAKTVLLLVGDTISKLTNAKDKTVSPLFGDAGSATLIQSCELDRKTYFSFHTLGLKYDRLIVPAGAFRKQKNQETAKEISYGDGNTRSAENLYMNGAEVFDFTLEEIPLAIKEILGFAGKTQDEIDYFVFHQANKHIIESIAALSGVPSEKAPLVISEYGNLSSVSIPATICGAMRQDLTGPNKNVLMSGFGVGLSWGTCLLGLKDIYCPEIGFYKGGNHD
ncbi:ketoacyl-ACP synthase III [Candidatus Saganbacteria bacterium]|nr:ketoacyl-ACP synthase III [Candidatus Saganbacteria bacterium]